MPTKKEIVDKIVSELRKNIESLIQYETEMEEMFSNSIPFDNKSLPNKIDLAQSIEKLIIFLPPEKTETIMSGSLIEINIKGKKQFMFITPCGGGRNIVIDGITIFILSRRAPLCLSLIGRKAGETISVNDKQITIKTVE